MKKKLFLLALVFLFAAQRSRAQSYSPIGVTGFNVDVIAEAATAMSTTNGTLDAAGWIFYSAAYGALSSSPYGLPNSGLLTAGSRTYQLQPYTANNDLLLPANTVDSLVLTSPAAYSGISLAAFASEGNSSMNVTIRFTDNSTFFAGNIALLDWFGAATNIAIGGVDRCLRSNGTPALTPGAAGNPKIFYYDIPISCTDRSKLIKTIKIQNPGTGVPRSSVMAVSGAALPVFTENVSPVTCSGGNNGSATITANGGVAPFGYTISTTPVSNSSVVPNIGSGIYSYTVQDGGLCPVTSTFAITQSLTAQPPLNVTANSTNICMGSTVVVGVTGAATYTWSNGSNQSGFLDSPMATTIYTVAGTTVANCSLSGSITVNVNPIPVVAISGIPNALCINASTVAVLTSPGGGTLTGQGLLGTTFSPTMAGVGTKTISYSYTDANNCSASTITTLVVNALPVIGFTASASELCVNSPSINFNANPAGGTYSGPGVAGTVFSPTAAGVGNHMINYSYTDANNCTASVNSSVKVNSLPVITFTLSKTVFCTTAPFVQLTGSPNGGSYSGHGITGSLFTPSVAGNGTHTLSYTNSDVNTGCTDVRIVTVTVGSCAGLGENKAEFLVASYPNPNSGAFTITSKNTLEVRIINSIGQELSRIALDVYNNYTVNMAHLNPGIYFILADEIGLKQKVIVLK